MNRQSINKTVQPNTDFLNQLRSLLPQFFTQEKVNDNGEIAQPSCFDFQKFHDALKSHDIKELQNGYRLDFTGKDYARRQAGEQSETIIVPDNEHNRSPENKNSKNLFFTGDNLEVLRHLQNNYANSVDFIYIDPPYNTGGDGFTYPDKFEYSDEQLKNLFSLNDEELARLKTIQGRSTHSAWLTFMYPRLYLARKLLKNDGAIFVSIDDNEQANLKLLMDDVFGENGFITQFIWEKTQHFGRQKVNYYSNADYIIAYTKNPAVNGQINELLVEFEKEEFCDAPLYNNSNPENSLSFPPGTVKFNMVDGEYLSSTDSKYKLLNPVVVEDGHNKNELQLLFRSRWSNKNVQEEIHKGTTFWVKTDKFAIRAIYADGKKSNESPKQILFSNQKNPAMTKSRFQQRIDTSENASSALNKLLGGDYFSYPKPVSLIKYLISLFFNNGYHSDLTIMDFFAGSATTADAVMQLNAEDGGSRRYILVQLPEPTRKASAAHQAGYRSIDEISRARIEKAAAKIKMENPLLADTQDLGFKHYCVVKPEQPTLDQIDDYDPNRIELFNDMISPFSGESLHVPGNATGIDTILTTYLVQDGYKFDEQVTDLNLAGYDSSYVGKTRVYLIAEHWGSEQTKALVNLIGTNAITVQTVIVYGYSFAMESMRELEIALSQLETKVNLVVRY